MGKRAYWRRNVRGFANTIELCYTDPALHQIPADEMTTNKWERVTRKEALREAAEQKRFGDCYGSTTIYPYNADFSPVWWDGADCYGYIRIGRQKVKARCHGRLTEPCNWT